MYQTHQLYNRLCFKNSLALSKFCEAILDYVANIEKAPDSSVKKEAFAGHMYSAYDVLFNLWFNSREPKVCMQIKL